MGRTVVLTRVFQGTYRSLSPSPKQGRLSPTAPPLLITVDSPEVSDDNKSYVDWQQHILDTQPLTGKDENKYIQYVLSQTKHTELPPSPSAEQIGNGTIQDSMINRTAYLVSLWWLIAFDVLNEVMQTKVDLEPIRKKCKYISLWADSQRNRYVELVQDLHETIAEVTRQKTPTELKTKFLRLLTARKEALEKLEDQHGWVRKNYNIANNPQAFNVLSEMELFFGLIYVGEVSEIMATFFGDPPSTGKKPFKKRKQFD
tara:strand:+ start:104 stop:877 length:774 start_codon:yes stop_codon:yes gene_type:complete